MFSILPEHTTEFMDWPWSQIEPYYADLLARELTPATIARWLDDWSRLKALVSEAFARLDCRLSANTADEPTRERRQHFFTTVFQPAWKIDDQLRARWLAAGLAAPGYENILTRLQAEASFQSAADPALEAQDEELKSRYFEVTGAQNIEWEGRILPLTELGGVLAQPDRAVRERAWRLQAARRQADRDAINDIWRQMVAVRHRQAQHAGYPDFIAYNWRDAQRTEYTPEDCRRFYQAIAEIVTPAATRVYERYRQQLGTASLRPWDMTRQDYQHVASLPGVPAPCAPQTARALLDSGSQAFHRVDPALGRHFDLLREEGMLDVEPRPDKTPSGLSRTYAVTRRSFILMNMAGTSDDVVTLVHEVGHAFSPLETTQRSFLQLTARGGSGGGEWTELASQAAEFLTLPYWSAFYSPADAARAQAEHLENTLFSFTMMAVMGEFQHWVYAFPEAAQGAAEWATRWQELWRHFIPGIDWSGLEADLEIGWQRRVHLFWMPLFYVEYGIALLGALQLWRHALRDQAGAAAAYRRGLAAGGAGRSLRELYAEMGLELSLDAGMLREMVALVEEQLSQP